MYYSLIEITGYLNIILVGADALYCINRTLDFISYFVTGKMVKRLDLRKVALSHFQNDKKAPEIAKLSANKVHRSTIDRWLRRYQQTDSFEPKPKLGQPKTGRTKRLNNLVKKRLDSNNTQKSLRTMTKDFKSSVQTIKRVLNIDLKKKYYPKITAQRLKEDQKPIRKICCQWIRKNINHNKLKIMMSTDEKIFTKNSYFNPKNDVIWADDRSYATGRDGLYSNEKYPVSIMVALGATWYGLTSPYFFQQGQYLNGQTYHDKLLPFYQKEGNELFGHKN